MSASTYGHNSGMRFKKRKARFTFSEVHILLDEVRKNRHIVVGKFNRGVPTVIKKRTWAAITASINEIGECQREVIEVIKKWSDLKCDTKRKVAAIRAGVVPYRGTNPYISRELSPIENIVHQILELDGKRGRLPTTDGNIYSGTGLGDEEGGDEEEEEEDVMLGMPSSSIDNSNDGEMDAPTIPLPPHGLAMSVPSSVSVSLGQDEDQGQPSPLNCSRAWDTSQTAYEMQYEIGSEDQELQLMDSDEECDERAPPPASPRPHPAEDQPFPAGLRHAPASAPPAPPSPPSSGRPALSARDKIAHTTALSIRQQHDTNVLLETVSRSLELLSESVQQLAETQQEFVQDSLQLQRETVHILRDFASGALALMHDKLNGRPAL